MVNSIPMALCLAIISGCVVIITATVVLTARDLRQMLRRVNGLLPNADRVLRETHEAMSQGRRLLTRTQQMARRVEVVVNHVCDATTDALEQFHGFQVQAKRSLGKWFGNGHGTGAGPRRQHHGSR